MDEWKIRDIHIIEYLGNTDRTCPQSCRVRLVRLLSWSTLTTPWLSPLMLSTPRPVALMPSRPGRRTLTVRPCKYFQISLNIFHS